MVIQYNKRDLPNIVPISDLQMQINHNGYNYFESVAIRGIGVFDTLKSICQITVRKQMENLPQV